MGADPLMIMQNLYIVEGRPAWSSQFIIASINACGKYSPLRFKIEDLGVKEIEYEEIIRWENNRPVKAIKKVKIHDMRCVAWANEKGTETILKSPPVTIELAVKEGWFTKNGSKWQTMPEVMLRYRAASFFGKLYAPELLMGIQTAEEVKDSIFDLEADSSGAYTISIDDIRKPEPQQEAVKPEPEQPKPKANEIKTKGTATTAQADTASDLIQAPQFNNITSCHKKLGWSDERVHIEMSNYCGHEVKSVSELTHLEALDYADVVNSVLKDEGAK